jgi:hypothetical protein
MHRKSIWNIKWEQRDRQGELLDYGDLIITARSIIEACTAARGIVSRSRKIGVNAVDVISAKYKGYVDN